LRLFLGALIHLSADPFPFASGLFGSLFPGKLEAAGVVSSELRLLPIRGFRRRQALFAAALPTTNLWPGPNPGDFEFLQGVDSHISYARFSMENYNLAMEQ
jgi:hypothetical protein